MNLRTFATIGLLLVTSIAWAQEEKPEAEANQAPADQTTETRSLNEGDQAPDFELESLDGKKVKLSDCFQGDSAKPVVLLFSRAHW